MAGWQCVSHPEHRWQELIQRLTTRDSDPKCPRCSLEREIVERTAGPEGSIGPHFAAFGLAFGEDNLVDEYHGLGQPVLSLELTL